MSTVAVLGVAVLAACVLVVLVQAWRDVRVARWTGQDPRLDRRARRDAERRVRSTGGEGQG